ncbi:MAG: hypothetical protein KDE00_05545 [Rhodobacteraceae bacterium]|nr:hypothetical protein [Paracoccaceae bacterium]
MAALPALAEASMKRLTLRQDLLGREAIGPLDVGPSSYFTGLPPHGRARRHGLARLFQRYHRTRGRRHGAAALTP